MLLLLLEPNYTKSILFAYLCAAISFIYFLSTNFFALFSVSGQALEISAKPCDLGLLLFLSVKDNLRAFSSREFNVATLT